MASIGHGKWSGDLKTGRGAFDTGSGSAKGEFTTADRFGDGEGTNPEELVGAANAACFSMALALALSEHGHEVESVETTASVHLRRIEGGFEISRIDLVTKGSVPGIDEAHFSEHAEQAKQQCPVSKALAGPEITLEVAEFSG